MHVKNIGAFWNLQVTTNLRRVTQDASYVTDLTKNFSLDQSSIVQANVRIILLSGHEYRLKSLIKTHVMWQHPNAR